MFFLDQYSQIENVSSLFMVLLMLIMLILNQGFFYLEQFSYFCDLYICLIIAVLTP